jgi:branched-chain amino acid transport system substrate-binding protein
VRLHWPGLAAFAFAAFALTGCGNVVSSSEATGTDLTIYSGLPLQGPTAAISQQIEGGEKLALSQTGGRIGPFRVSYFSLDDANPKNGQPSPGETSTAAKEAAKDTSTIAYIGDYDSAATAVSLPIINEAGILQVSPASPYVGLTSSRDAGQDEPERFYPTGKQNFARLQPGDPAQAVAQVRLMQQLGVHRIYVLDDGNAFEMPLAAIVAEDAKRAGITVTGEESVQVEATQPGETLSFGGLIEKVVATRAQAVFLAGGSDLGAVRLWLELHDAEPRLLLLGSSGMDSEAFTSRLGAAGTMTYITTPLLAEGLYPASGRAVLAEYRRTFHSPGGPSVLYGYEAMSAVLEAIRRAGAHGNVRPDVIKAFMATRDRNSVLGTYSIEPDGETTLDTYGVDKVVEGRPVFYSEVLTSGSLTPTVP